MLSTSASLWAIITPTPCVPWMSFRIAGSPPTCATISLMSPPPRASTVRGMSTPAWASSCRARNLSRLLAIPAAPFTTGTPWASSWRTTASPAPVTEAPMRGIATATSRSSSPATNRRARPGSSTRLQASTSTTRVFIPRARADSTSRRVE